MLIKLLLLFILFLLNNYLIKLTDSLQVFNPWIN